MEIREILAVLRPDRHNDAVLAVTGRLASEYRAFVRGLCVFSIPAPTVSECYAVGDAAVSAVVDHLEQETKVLLAPTQTAFQASLAACGAAGDWCTLDGYEAAYEAPRRARLVDLVVLPRPDENEAGYRRLVELFLIEGGTPCLIVPDAAGEASGFRRILIAWSGTREAKRALDAALPLLRRAEAVEVVIAGDPPQTHVNDRPDALTVHLARHGIAAEVTEAPAGHDPAETILERCAAFGADLLVMGAYGHSRTAEALLGGVSRTILTRAPLPVLMAR